MSAPKCEQLRAGYSDRRLPRPGPKEISYGLLRHKRISRPRAARVHLPAVFAADDAGSQVIPGAMTDTKGSPRVSVVEI
jgi:hypothetical protein